MRYILLPLVLILTSCAQTQIRTNYKLKKIGPFIVSNSLTNPYKLTTNKESLDSKYILIVKNISSKTQLLRTNKPYIDMDSEKVKLSCKSPKELSPNDQAKISCSIKVDKRKGTYVNKDIKAKVQIFLNSKYVFNSNFDFKIEDFE